MHVCARVGIACNCGSQSATVYLCHGVLSIISLCVFVCSVDADAQVSTAEEDKQVKELETKQQIDDAKR